MATVALVTGSSRRGIGRGIVKALAGEHRVVIHGLEDISVLDAIATDLNDQLGFGGGNERQRRVFAVSGDIRDDAICQRIVRDVQSRFGSLDVLVNNAGCQHVAPIVNFPTGEYERIVDTILKSTWLMTKYALPSMLENKWGRIINTGSMHATVSRLNDLPTAHRLPTDSVFRCRWPRRTNRRTMRQSTACWA